MPRSFVRCQRTCPFCFYHYFIFFPLEVRLVRASFLERDPRIDDGCHGEELYAATLS